MIFFIICVVCFLFVICCRRLSMEFFICGILLVIIVGVFWIFFFIVRIFKFYKYEIIFERGKIF